MKETDNDQNITFPVIKNEDKQQVLTFEMLKQENVVDSD